MANGEYLDIVDENDNVIGKSLYEDVYKNLSHHRVVHVLLFNVKRELLVQLRTFNKPRNGGTWVSSAGGHVKAGETYEEAAKRETKEELGIAPKITQKYKDLYTDIDGHKKFLVSFIGNTDNTQFTIDPIEAQKVELKSLGELK